MVTHLRSLNKFLLLKVQDESDADLIVNWKIVYFRYPKVDITVISGEFLILVLRGCTRGNKEEILKISCFSRSVVRDSLPRDPITISVQDLAVELADPLDYIPSSGWDSDSQQKGFWALFPSTQRLKWVKMHVMVASRCISSMQWNGVEKNYKYAAC